MKACDEEQLLGHLGECTVGLHTAP
jgi:hypothetical protein